MRGAIVDAAGTVVNIVELPEGWSGAPGEWRPPDGHAAIDGNGAAIGDTWDGAAFARPARQPAADSPTTEEILDAIIDQLGEPAPGSKLEDVKTRLDAARAARAAKT